jgi:hypothetical protein
MIYIPKFIQIGPGTQKLTGGDSQTRHRYILVDKETAWRSHKATLIFPKYGQ